MKINKIDAITQEIFSYSSQDKYTYRFEYNDFTKEDLDLILKNGKREIEIVEFKPKVVIKSKQQKGIQISDETREKLEILNLQKTKGSIEFVEDKTIEEIEEIAEKYITRKDIMSRTNKTPAYINAFLCLGSSRGKTEEALQDLKNNIIEINKCTRLYPVHI